MAVLSAVKFGVPSPVTCNPISPSAARPLHYPLSLTAVTHRIPPLKRRKAIRAAPGVTPVRDVRERIRALQRVQERVQEAQRRPALLREQVVQQRDDAGYNGGGALRARDLPALAREHDLHVVALRGEVRVRTPAPVEVPRVPAPELGQVPGHGGGLV